jgi:DNA-binding FadR family transcriptional regulator
VGWPVGSQDGPDLGFEAEGLARSMIEHSHRSGVDVTDDDLLGAHRLIEPLCARVAAAHPGRGPAMARFVRPLVAHDVPPEDLGSEASFREVVYRLTDNPALSLLAQAIAGLVSHRFAAAGADLDAQVRPVQAAVASAIVRGDGDDAEQLLRDHLVAVHDRWQSDR